MRKFIVLFVIVILLLIVASPGINGYFFKRHYFNLIDILNQEGSVKIDVLNYEEGWRRSHAAIRVKPMAWAAQANSPTLIIDNNIVHGPLLHNMLRNGYTLGFATIQSIVKFSDPSGKIVATNAEINTLTTLGGSWNNHINISEVHATQPSQGQLAWQGLKGRIDLKTRSDMISRIHANLIFGAITIDNLRNKLSFKRLVVQPISYKRDTYRVNNPLWSGTTNISLPNLTATLSDSQNVIANQFNLSSHTGEGSAEASYSARINATLKSLATPSTLLPSLSDFSLQLNIDNLDAQGLVNLTNHFKAMPNKNITTQDAIKYLALFPRLFTPSSAVSLNWNFNTPDGPFHLDSSLTWRPNAIIATINDLYQNGRVLINLRIAVPLVNKFVADWAAKTTTNVPVQTPAENAKKTFSQTVGNLYQQGKITLPVSVKIIEISDQRVTLEVFATTIQPLGLTPEVMQQVNQAYQQYLMQLSTPATPQTQAQLQAQQKQAAQQIQTTMINQMINNWLTEGYLKIENNVYIASIVYEDNAMTVNGKIFPLSSHVPIPLTPGLKLPSRTTVPATP